MADTLSDHPARETARRWHDHLAQSRRRSPHTVRAYVATAHRLIEFLAQHLGDAVDAAALAGLTPADLRAFLTRRRAEGLGNSSAARELSAVRGFLAFAAADAGTDAGVPRLRSPKKPRSVPRPVSPDEAVALAEEAGEDAHAPWIAARDEAVLLLLYGSGLRVAEALGLPGACRLERLLDPLLLLRIGLAISLGGRRHHVHQQLTAGRIEAAEIERQRKQRLMPVLQPRMEDFGGKSLH